MDPETVTKSTSADLTMRTATLLIALFSMRIHRLVTPWPAIFSLFISCFQPAALYSPFREFRFAGS